MQNSNILNNTFDIKKKPGENGKAKFAFETNKDGTINVKQYNVKFGKLDSQGSIILSKNHDLLSATSTKTKLHDGNFSFSYKNLSNSKSLNIEGSL